MVDKHMVAHCMEQGCEQKNDIHQGVLYISGT